MACAYHTTSMASKMNQITRRDFLGITATSVGSLWVGDAWSTQAKSPVRQPTDEFEALYQHFQDPDHKYSIRPFWFWNGKLDGEELGRQIRQMVEHGVFGAYAHNRDGLQTPYLSEDWWQAVCLATRQALSAIPIISIAAKLKHKLLAAFTEPRFSGRTDGLDSGLVLYT